MPGAGGAVAPGRGRRRRLLVLTTPGVARPVSWDGVLVRFGEVGIKSPPVRRQMLGRLQNNLMDAMVLAAVEGNVAVLGSRLWMQGPDVAALADVATHTFGVVSVSPAMQASSKMEDLCEAAAALALTRDGWTSFAIRASREGKHEYSSQEMGIECGSAVFTAAEAAGRSPKVDLSNPDLEVFIEVRDAKAYLYVEKQPGPGGLPVGSQGKVVGLVSDAASGLACWFMLRRGCRVVPIHAGDQGSVPLEVVEPLIKWGLQRDIDILPVCSGSVAKQTLVEAAASLGRRIGAVAVVTGDTLESNMQVDGVLPVLRPLAGLDPAVVQQWMERVGGLDVRDDAPSILDEASSETLESILSMHRRVTV